MAKEVLHQLEVAHYFRALSMHEEQLRKFVKLKPLGLSSLQCSLARQGSRILWLHNSDAMTSFFPMPTLIFGIERIISIA
jgi:hypothetical protein